MNYKGYEDGIIRGSIGLGVDYYKGEKGDNGISPTISVVEIQNGHRVIINDVDGEKSFDILDGEDGEGGKGIITRSAEIAYNQVEGNIYRWQTIAQPDFTGINDFNYVRVSLKATHNDVSHPYSTYLTLYPNKPGTAFCGYCDGGIYTLTMVGSNWQGGCVDIYKINNKANEIDSVKREIGGLNDLMTEDTSSIVNAINEVQGLAMSNQYTLPTASTSTLGGVKVDGNTITIDQDGVISASDSGSDVVYTAGNGISISGNEISVNTDDLVGQGENIASVSYVDNAIANIPSSGGSSYTFTNGLTESNGTVSWDLNDRIKAGGQRGAVAVGYNTTASGDCSYAEGYGTKATSGASHAEGELTQAIGSKSHAEGYGTTASGGASHAEGNSTKAEGRSAHAEGNSTVAWSNEQHAEGMFNIGDSNSIFQNIAGNGTAYNARSNSFARDWNGNEYLAGNLYVGCNDYSTTANGLTTENAGGSKVATESYVDQAIADIPSSGGSSTITEIHLSGTSEVGDTVSNDILSGSITLNNTDSDKSLTILPGEMIFNNGGSAALVFHHEANPDPEAERDINQLILDGQILATEDYVNDAIANIPSSGGGESYTAGSGISIDSNNVISAKNTYSGHCGINGLWSFWREAANPNGGYMEQESVSSAEMAVEYLLNGLVIQPTKNITIDVRDIIDTYPSNGSYMIIVFNLQTKKLTEKKNVRASDNYQYSLSRFNEYVKLDNYSLLELTNRTAATVQPSGLLPYFIIHQSANYTTYNVADNLDEVMETVNTRVPTPPSTDGNYILTCAVNNGSITYTWVDATIGGTY